MGDGLSAAAANLALTAAVADWVFTQLHTGAPGAAGTSNVSSVTTRPATSWGTASAGAIAANGTLPKWTSWAGTNGQTQTAISGWSLSSSGTYGGACTLSASVTMNTGDELDLTAITITHTTAS